MKLQIQENLLATIPTSLKVPGMGWQYRYFLIAEAYHSVPDSDAGISQLGVGLGMAELQFRVWDVVEKTLKGFFCGSLEQFCDTRRV